MYTKPYKMQSHTDKFNKRLLGPETNISVFINYKQDKVFQLQYIGFFVRL